MAGGDGARAGRVRPNQEISGDEIYGLTSQLNRAAVSVPSNLAEGYGRGGRDYERFVGLAYGSLLELETQAELAQRIGLVRDGESRLILERTASVGKMRAGGTELVDVPCADT